MMVRSAASSQRQDLEAAVSPKVAEQKFSIDEVAKNMGMSRSTVYRLMQSGKLGFYQVRRRRPIGEGHLQEYFALSERRAH